MVGMIDCDTPAVLVDLDIVERNIACVAQTCATQGVALRPHIKTHRIPKFAQLQLAAGAVGITCQKLGEAEVMMDAGIDDVLLTYNIVGAAKLRRLLALAGRMRKLTVTADSLAVAQGLSATFADSGHTLPVLVECDTGAGRCGVQSPAAAATLAGALAGLPGLAFAGLMTYPPAREAVAVNAWLRDARERCATAGQLCATISNGGTPGLQDLAPGTEATEYRAGTYIYNDRFMVSHGHCTLADCALTVLATVVSVPAPGRAIIDAGSKLLSSDLLGQPDHGEAQGAPAIRVVALSEEHGHISLPATVGLAVGDQLRIVPNHACVVSNLVDEIAVLRAGVPVERLPVLARGRSD